VSHFSLTALAAIFTALMFVLVGLRRAANRSIEKVGSLLFDGAACGPLILILLSPIQQLVNVGPDLYEEVVKGEPVLLWLAVTYAAVNLLWKLR
jgi:hypothetical protein